MKKNNVKTVRRYGFSDYISVTGLAHKDERYQVEQIDEKTIKLTRID